MTMNSMHIALPADEQSHPALTVCVIGRNEGRHLADAVASFALLDEAGIDYETMFVDSASTDDSVRIANELFDTVIVLEANAGLNAGAARNVGTLAARGDWVLYLDGDMELLQPIIGPISALIGSGDLQRGLSGYTVNHFNDGGCGRIHYSGNRAGAPCASFGGAVLLPRLAVLEAGNWPTSLFAYEETELYSRLDRSRVRVIWNEVDFVKHKTPRIANRRKATGLLWPRGSYLGKKFYGAGQVTRLTLANGNFWRFAAIKPWGYVVLAAAALTLLALPFTLYGALIFVATAVAIIVERGVKSLFVYCSWLPQVVLGCPKLDRSFVPRIASKTEAETRDARIGRRQGR